MEQADTLPSTQTHVKAGGEARGRCKGSHSPHTAHELCQRP